MRDVVAASARSSSLDLAWAGRLGHLSGLLYGTSGEPSIDRNREEAWVLFHAALARYLRIHAWQRHGISREDREDLASSKALHLLQRVETGHLDLRGRSEGEIAALLATVARNSLRDHLRSTGRIARILSFGRSRAHFTDQDSTRADETEQPIRRREFAEALRACASQLSPRSRLVWLLRAFYEMSSREIAEHPEVHLGPAHVDVLLQRTRTVLSECMGRHGLDATDMPPGTFVEIWRAFRLEVAESAAGINAEDA